MPFTEPVPSTEIPADDSLEILHERGSLDERKIVFNGFGSLDAPFHGLPKTERLEVTLAANAIVELATFFTEKSFEVTPAMIMSRNTLPSGEVENWDSLTKQLETIDPQKRVIPEIVASMKSKMAQLLSSQPATSGSEISKLLMDRDKIVETQRTSSVITPDMCRLVGDTMALITFGRLPQESLRDIIQSDSPKDSEEQILEIMDIIENVNFEDSNEVYLKLLINGRLPKTLKSIQESADSVDLNTTPDFRAASWFLAEVRLKYKDKQFTPKQWSDYLGEVNKAVMDARLARMSKPLIICGDVSQKMSLDEGYAFLMANYLYGKEQKLVN